MAFTHGVDMAAPVGTPDEITNQGADPAEWGSCEPPNKQLGVRGCEFYRSCIFRNEELGNYRGQGPENCLVMNVNRENGTARQTVYPCYHAMQRKHDFDAPETAVRWAGIVGKPGDTYEDEQLVVDFPFEAKGKLVRKVEVKTVPHYPRPGEEGSRLSSSSTFASKMMAAVKRRKEEHKFKSVSDELAVPDEPVKRGPGRPRKVAAPD